MTASLILLVLLQFIYAGKKATLNIGNIKPIGEMPEGTIICNVEEVSRGGRHGTVMPQQLVCATRGGTCLLVPHRPHGLTLWVRRHAESGRPRLTGACLGRLLHRGGAQRRDGRVPHQAAIRLEEGEHHAAPPTYCVCQLVAIAAAHVAVMVERDTACTRHTGVGWSTVM